MKAILPLLLAVTLLGAGCDAPKRQATEQDKALQRAIEQPQQKARDVERQLQQDSQRKRQEIDAQGG